MTWVRGPRLTFGLPIFEEMTKGLARALIEPQCDPDDFRRREMVGKIENELGLCLELRLMLGLPERDLNSPPKRASKPWISRPESKAESGK